jgi:hypothetical protein
MEVFGRIEPSEAVGCIVIVKFFINNNKTSRNEILTRTLGKIGVINSLYQGEAIQDKDVWRVRILRETHVGINKGCFVLEPMERLEAESITRLLPGLYVDNVVGGILFIRPKRPGYNWILPLSHKRSIRDVYAIIVDLKHLISGNI